MIFDKDDIAVMDDAATEIGYAAEDSWPTVASRLEYLRGQLRAECISWGELVELQGLAEQIDPSDVELLEAAGVPEFAEDES
jgi:hypothetical protein